MDQVLGVLILIMLEGGFCFTADEPLKAPKPVLILIMLEGGFCFSLSLLKLKTRVRLNPYYAGRWFLLTLPKALVVFTSKS